MTDLGCHGSCAHYNDMNLRNRVSRLERICQNRLNRGTDDQSAQHDRVTGDNLLRIWEGGADDWVRVRMEQVIEKCDGLSPEAKARLQERLRILKMGCPQEILLVLAGLSRDCIEWCSAREGDVIEAALKGDPALAKAAVECGILRAGRKDWRAFACWLERRGTRAFGCDGVSAEDPKIPGAIFRWAPDVNSATDEPSPTYDLPP
jgi:hypothetical protein